MVTTQETTEAQVVVDALEAITDTTGAGDNWCSGVPFVVMEQLQEALPIARAQAQREQAQAASVARVLAALAKVDEDTRFATLADRDHFKCSQCEEPEDDKGGVAHRDDCVFALLAQPTNQQGAAIMAVVSAACEVEDARAERATLQNQLPPWDKWVAACRRYLAAKDAYDLALRQYREGAS